MWLEFFIMHILKIILEDGRIVHACPSDLLDVFDFVRPPKGVRDWERLSGEEVLRRYKLKSVKLYLKMETANIRTSANFPIHPYLLGALLGDGSFGKRNVTIAKPYPEFIERVRTNLPSGYKLNQINDLVHSIVMDGADKSFYELMTRLSLAETKSESKFIPASYLYGSDKERLELLSGLLDSDGTCSADKAVGFFTSSPSLAMGVRYLVWSLGGIASISSAKRTSKVFNGKEVAIQPEYRVSIKYPNPLELFTIPHKRRPLLEPSRFSKNPKIKIVSVEEELIDPSLNYTNSPFIKCW